MNATEPKHLHSGLSTRGVVLVAFGVVGISGTALFAGLWAVPLWQTHQILRDLKMRMPTQEYDYKGLYDMTLRRLGGPERACGRLVFYLRQSSRFAPEKEAALAMLALCAREMTRHETPGEVRLPAGKIIPEIEGTLGSKDAGVREMSAKALGWIGPEARDAVPALEKLLKDSDEDVRQAAAEALKKIHGEEE